ncbi:MAG TPA: hypothetical protein VHH10_08980 [Rubrobacteraceae bacterium]|nr:hypothetical protein [Rubrobacteraceae bacterium]
MDRSGDKRADTSAAGPGGTAREPEMVKERETKEDGRYIIFYSFGDGEEQEDG